MLISILAFVAVLAVLIVVHEAGHFLVAKRLGIRVLRFSIGYPPRLFGFRRGETEYVIGATPFGGYVRMLGDEVGEEPKSTELATFLNEIRLDLVELAQKAGVAAVRAEAPLMAVGSNSSVPSQQSIQASSNGMDAGLVALANADADMTSRLSRALRPEESAVLREVRERGSVKDALDALCERRSAIVLEAFRQRAFPTQSLLKRTAVVLAGPAANILFAPILMTIVFMWGVPTLLPVVGEVETNMPAATSGFAVGDRVVAINGSPTKSWDALSEAVKESNGKTLRVEVQRQDGGHTSLSVVPKALEQKTITGADETDWVIGVKPRGDQFVTRYGPISAGWRGLVGTEQMMIALVEGIAQIVNGSTPVRDALGGPIMIAQMAGHEAHQGFADLAMFTVMLSLELGILNVLPVPLLDGGHLLFFAFEGVRGKPLDLRHREIALQVGLFLLVMLMVFVVINDITRIVRS